MPLSVILLPVTKYAGPPIDDAAMLRAVVPPRIAAIPADPVVFKLTAPVKAPLRTITPLFARVVKEEVPEIVSGVSSSARMLPVVTVAVRFPPTVDVAKSKSSSLTTVALPDPLVARATVPSTASVPKLITPLFASVVAERFSPTVTVPLSVIPDALPLLSVRFPATDEVAILRAVVPPSILASSLIFKLIAPVNALVVLSITISPLEALVVKEEVPEIVNTPLSKISLAAVGPLLVATRLPAVTLLKVMSPLVRFVFPVPALIVALNTPVPVFIVVPDANVITAAPESRCASTTPLLLPSEPVEVTSFAINVRSPLSVVIFALTSTERPACKVKSPPSPPELFAVMASDTVMSLLACRTTLVAADNKVMIALGVIVELLEEFVAKTAELTASPDAAAVYR